ncbi:hypothetical protein PWT90_09112 [Aphanocladium album]|nr:hypothetical protein PWT90_09112 [Aphanocladium album]
MEALGSSTNVENLVLLWVTLNDIKKRIWASHAIHADDAFKLMLEDESPKPALEAIRDSITVLNYLNHHLVSGKMHSINTFLRAEFRAISNSWNANNRRQINLEDCWTKWFPAHLLSMRDETKIWVSDAIKQMRAVWHPDNNSGEDYHWISLQVNEHLDRLERSAANDIVIDISQL